MNKLLLTLCCTALLSLFSCKAMDLGVPTPQRSDNSTLKGQDLIHYQHLESEAEALKANLGFFCDEVYPLMKAHPKDFDLGQIKDSEALLATLSKAPSFETQKENTTNRLDQKLHPLIRQLSQLYLQEINERGQKIVKLAEKENELLEAQLAIGVGNSLRDLINEHYDKLKKGDANAATTNGRERTLEDKLRLVVEDYTQRLSTAASKPKSSFAPTKKNPGSSHGRGTIQILGPETLLCVTFLAGAASGAWLFSTYPNLCSHGKSFVMNGVWGLWSKLGRFGSKS